jgi:hypothetical protein
MRALPVPDDLRTVYLAPALTAGLAGRGVGAEVQVLWSVRNLAWQPVDAVRLFRSLECRSFPTMKEALHCCWLLQRRHGEDNIVFLRIDGREIDGAPPPISLGVPRQRPITVKRETSINPMRPVAES